VFVRSGTTWLQEDILEMTDAITAGDRFGYEVSMTNDGLKVAVGCPYKTSTGAGGAGAVYVFSYTPSGWVQEAKIVASDRLANDTFGWSVAISGDSSRIVVGAVNVDNNSVSNVGAVYIFVNNNNVWTQEAKILKATRATSDNFGWSVAIDQLGNRIVVGCPHVTSNAIANNGAVYTYTRNNSIWTLEKEILPNNNYANINFGTEVRITRDSNRLVTSSIYSLVPGSNTPQSVILYGRVGNVWNKEIELNNPPRSNNIGFGVAVAFDAIGDILAVGAINGLGSSNIISGSAYIYE
jgi:hypothetical protein